MAQITLLPFKRRDYPKDEILSKKNVILFEVPDRISWLWISTLH